MLHTQHRSAYANYAPAQSRTRARQQLVVTASQASQSRTTPETIHNGRLPFLEQLEQYVSPKRYGNKVLQGHKFAWGKTGLLLSKDTLFVADLDAARSVMASEMQLGIGSDWPETFRDMLGESSLSMTQDMELHARLRQYLGLTFTKEAMQQLLPQLQTLAATHLGRLARATTGTTTTSSSSSNRSASPAALTTTADGSMVLSYPAVRLLSFEILVNQALNLSMTDAEIQQYSGLFETLIDGFLPPAWDVPFTPYGKGLKARQQLADRIMQTMRSPRCSGALARLRDVFGVESPVTVDNVINLMFAGFDTTSSSITYMLSQLAQHPHVLEKVHQEQLGVVSKHGPTLTSAAYQEMPYTLAVIKETLRMAQIVAYVPRVATRELPVPGGPTLTSGCPFIIALAAMSASDPAVKGEVDSFQPERWLDPANAKSLAQHQLPFGTGQRTCLGMNLAYAEMAAFLSELGRTYTLAADTATEWRDFPIKKPANGMPIRLTQRVDAAGAAGAAQTGAAAAAGV